MFPDAEMPEHDLEPPRFSRRALERILNDWLAVKSMIMSGCEPPKERTQSANVVFEDQVYLKSQSGTSHLDKFTHCLLVKCSVEVSDVGSSRLRIALSPRGSPLKIAGELLITLLNLPRRVMLIFKWSAVKYMIVEESTK